MNYTASQLVKYNVIRDMILKGESDAVNVHTEKIKRKKNGRTEGGSACVSLIMELEDKIYTI
jgi:hypothetical protein